MPKIHVSREAVLDAPPDIVYGLIADYRSGHPRILPAKYFGPLEVEKGGTGAGTVFRCGLRMGGRVQPFRSEVTEPEPGRVLVETSLDADLVTTFRVVPEGDGRRSRVTFETVGTAGLLQWLIVRPFLRRVYAEELKQLERVAREKAAAADQGR